MTYGGPFSRGREKGREREREEVRAKLKLMVFRRCVCHVLYSTKEGEGGEERVSGC